MTLNAFFWNARGLLSKNTEIIHNSRDCEAFFVTETKSKRNDHLLIPGFESYTCNKYNNGEGGAGGVAMFIRHRIKKQILDISNAKGSFDALGVRLFIGSETINIIVIYRRPGKVEPHGTWRDLLNAVNKNEGLIVLGDFNAHHSAWNCDTIDTNGERLLEEFEEEDLFIVNFDTKSRVGEIGQRDSNLDLIFCNPKVMHLMSYSQGSDAWGSDHFPIFFECRFNCKRYTKKSNRITSGKTDWNKYIGLLQDRELDLESEEFVNSSEEYKYIFLTNILKKTAFEATGKGCSMIDGRVVRSPESLGALPTGRRGWSRRNPAEWWDGECDELVRSILEIESVHVGLTDIVKV